MGVRVGGGGETDSFLDGELEDFVGRIKFVDGFAPAGSREFDGKAARGDRVERFSDEIANRRRRSVAVDLDQVEMRQTIDEASRGDLADAAKVIGVNVVDLAIAKLFGAVRHAVEHLVGPVEIMD